MTGRMRLFTASELEKTPSRAVGLAAVYEDRLRSFMCRFMTDVGKRLKLSMITVATACVHLHQFYMHFPVNHFDKYEVSAACLWLAGKVEEQRAQVQFVCEAVYYQRHRVKLDRESSQYKDLRCRVLSIEILLLQCIGFNFRALHPYSCCMEFVKKLFADTGGGAYDRDADRKEVGQFTWRFMNDSIRTTLCLVYMPQKIAIACIHMAILWRNRACKRRREAKAKEGKAGTDGTHDLSCEDIVLEPLWFQKFVPDMTKAELNRICDVLLSALEEPPVKTGSNAKHRKRKADPSSSRREQNKRLAVPSSVTPDLLTPPMDVRATPEPLSAGASSAGSVEPTPSPE